MKLREHLERMAIELAEIRKDLNYHIMRTDILEKQTKPVIKVYHWIQVSGAIIVTFSTLLGALKLIGVI